MTVIFITGFMGAGKTSVGEALGQSLGRDVIDTDLWIENEQGKSVQQIFSEEGEDVFRRYETDALKQLTRKDGIVTTGGGIVTKAENRSWMSEHGFVVYLHCTPEECYRRLATDTDRPLLAGKSTAQIKEMLENRLPYYEKANITIDTTGQTITQVVEEIAERLTNGKQNRP